MTKKKRHVLVGQSWFDKNGEFRILAAAGGYAMCLREWERVPWLRSFEVLNSECALKEDVLPKDQKLSNQEYAVMQRIALGLSVNEISQRLGVAPSTVSTYRTRILRKLGMKSNAEIAVFVSSGHEPERRAA